MEAAQQELGPFATDPPDTFTTQETGRRNCLHTGYVRCILRMHRGARA